MPEVYELLLKMDVEGSEMEILTELNASGKLKLIREMCIEYHHHIDPESDRLSEFLALLEQNGFGYHLSASFRKKGAQVKKFQNILIHAYQKELRD